MRKNDIRMPDYQDRIGDYDVWTCPSWSGTGETYTIQLVVEKDNEDYGKIWCSCMDSTCRKKKDFINADHPNLCKHATAVLRIAGLMNTPWRLT